MGRPGWYVLQVETGREEKACETVRRACAQADALDGAAEPTLVEAFSPTYRSRFKLRGEWHDEERRLTPGYVVAVTARPGRLAQVLRAAPGFERLLTAGETYASLSKDDRAWIERWTSEGDRVVPLSVAYKEGDRIVVTEGPLKGREASIVRVRRRQCLAEIEIRAGQLRIRTTVGLAVLPEEAAGAGEGAREASDAPAANEQQ